MARVERRFSGRPNRRRERVIDHEAPRSQLLEEGDRPSGPVGAFAGGSGDLTSEGGRGTNTPDRYGGPFRRRDDPRYGDWTRHATGGGSGALGGEGAVYEGEHTWGESDAERGAGGRATEGSIRDLVIARLDRHPEIDATGIEVLVEEGEVTLQGTVPDREMHRLAEGVAESVAGVSLVHNQLRLARP